MHTMEYVSGKLPAPKIIVLCHYPLAIWDRRHYGAWHLYGHTHGAYTSDGLALDVGVDNWHYTPVSINQIIEAMKEKHENQSGQMG